MVEQSFIMGDIVGSVPAFSMIFFLFLSLCVGAPTPPKNWQYILTKVHQTKWCKCQGRPWALALATLPACGLQ